MKYKSFDCHFAAFSTEENTPIHKISVPENKLTGEIDKDLEVIFTYGQNDFKPISERKKVRSLSSGDIIDYQGVLYFIDDFGFVKEGEQVEKGMSVLFLKDSKSKVLHEKFPSIFNTK